MGDARARAPPTAPARGGKGDGPPDQPLAGRSRGRHPARGGLGQQRGGGFRRRARRPGEAAPRPPSATVSVPSPSPPTSARRVDRPAFKPRTSGLGGGAAVIGRRGRGARRRVPRRLGTIARRGRAGQRGARAAPGEGPAGAAPAPPLTAPGRRCGRAPLPRELPAVARVRLSRGTACREAELALPSGARPACTGSGRGSAGSPHQPVPCRDRGALVPQRPALPARLAALPCLLCPLCARCVATAGSALVRGVVP
ncbi:uncharacterized protein LOC141731055 [Zonotrichia albicollis]|uniref:uncharacterized protein LOC141731055 n=1 Tax=Zonotrichia albicollis TaxID=44394 RepID=UPI003D8101A4